MKYKRFITLFIPLLLCIVLLCSCAQTSPRVQKALDKMKDVDAAHIKGSMRITLDAEKVNMDMIADYDVKVTSDKLKLLVHSKTGLSDTDINIYGIGGRYYMYTPALMDKYIDMTSTYGKSMGLDSFVNMPAFDFDAGTTAMNITESSNTGTLMVNVYLGDEQMKKLIKDVYVNQNLGTDALSGQSLDYTFDLLDSMKIDSASFTIYIDKDDNIFRYEINTEISVDYLGEKDKITITANYDVLETGDSVNVDIPDIPPEDIISAADLGIKR